MGLTKRKDSYYVAFQVVASEDGKTLRLATGVRGSKLKRWKVGCLNKTVAREMEATIKTNLMQGKILTEEAQPVLFSEWAKQYLEIETVKSMRSFVDRSYRVTHQLVPFFGGKIITEIKPKDVESYRAQRLGRNGKPVSLQSINHDQVALKHCLNVAVRRGLLSYNPASRVPIPNPQNERDRILTEEEWGKLYEVAKPYVKPMMLLANHWTHLG